MAHEDEGEDKNGNVFVGLNNSVTLADQLNEYLLVQSYP